MVVTVMGDDGLSVVDPLLSPRVVGDTLSALTPCSWKTTAT